jgi:agmatinase
MERYRASLPCVGIPSFLRSPICEDFSRVEAEVAFLGVPYDVGISYRPGCRFGPRDIRVYSTRYSAWGASKDNGYYDINAGKRRLKNICINDCGDIDVLYYDQDWNFNCITSSIEKLLDRGCLPIIVGGDHSITFPSVKAFKRFSPLAVIHFDAHLDWINEVEGMRYANGSPLRRVAELDFIGQMTHIGIRCPRSREEDINAAKARGNLIVTRDQLRKEGSVSILNRIPQMPYVYVTIDIDALDPSIAPGTGSPTVDGIWYYELREILQGIAAKGKVVGFDLVEVNPLIDPFGQTSLLATTAIIEFLGAIFDK